MPLPFDNMQASLALTQFIPLSGIFPSNNQDSNVDPGGIPLGAIRTFAGNFAPGAGPPPDPPFGGSAGAEGQLVPISQNTALFSLLGTMYGGNGQTTFALPDLDGRTMIGGQLGFGSRPAIGSNDTRLVNAELPSSLGGSFQPFDNYQSSLPVTYLIRTGGLYPGNGSGVDFIGQIVPFAGNFVPDGFLQANGQELLINDYPLLFSLIGTMYGGDGNTTFALPNLTGRTAVGATSQLPLGAYFGQETSLLLNSQLPVAAGGNGQPVDNHEPSASITYLIAAAGIFPPHDSGAIDPANRYLGEIVAVAFDASLAPNGWFEARGQLLPINQNQALFSLLGTMYGGNGQTTFALPDLRDRAAIGTGDEAQIAHVLGSNTFTLLPDNIPERLHDFNGDFNSDILWRHDSGQVYFWEMDGLGVKAEGAVAHAAVPNVWHIEGTGDFDADRSSDIFWRHDSGQVYVWEMNGLNVKTEGTIVHAAVPTTWHVEGISDFDGDLKSDILWRHDSGQVYLWEMNGLGIKAEGSVVHAAVPTTWHVEGIGDFDGDGKSDILWRHDSGQVYIWEMNGLGIKAEGSVVHAAVPNDYHIQGVGDFDGDGKSDILWRHDSGQVYIWEMEGLNVKAEGAVAHAPVTSDWHVQSVGAQYGDSNSDILWRNDNGQVYVWEMNGLQIKAEGGIAHAAVPNDWHILS
jgi:microcystin-dependent protein